MSRKRGDRTTGPGLSVSRTLARAAMLFQRWELASRNRLAGAGFKPPSAAAFKRRGRERLWKRHREAGQASGNSEEIGRPQKAGHSHCCGPYWANRRQTSHRADSRYSVPSGLLWIPAGTVGETGRRGQRGQVPPRASDTISTIQRLTITRNALPRACARARMRA